MSAHAAGLRERDHVHDQVAAEFGIDPDRLRAELADAITAPLPQPGANP